MLRHKNDYKKELKNSENSNFYAKLMESTKHSYWVINVNRREFLEKLVKIYEKRENKETCVFQSTFMMPIKKLTGL